MQTVEGVQACGTCGGGERRGWDVQGWFMKRCQVKCRFVPFSILQERENRGVIFIINICFLVFCFEAHLMLKYPKFNEKIHVFYV